MLGTLQTVDKKILLAPENLGDEYNTKQMEAKETIISCQPESICLVDDWIL